MSNLASLFDKRPILVVLAGPNGGGKSTFYETFLEPYGLHFVNADVLARELGIDAYSAARVATSLREQLLRQRESFIFETVFSDPAGDKLGFMRDAADNGFTVVLCFIGISGSETSERRVSQRVIEGGHDVPSDKLTSRFPRTLENLRRALRELPYVLVYDNDDLNDPYRLITAFVSGERKELYSSVPQWLAPLLQ